MLLRNYDNLMTAKRLCAITGTGSTDTSTFGDGHINVMNTSGTIKAIYLPSATANYGQMLPLHIFDLLSNSYPTHSQSYNNLICGSGLTKETYEDYKLESIFTTKQITQVSHRFSERIYDAESNTYSRTYYKVFCANEAIEVSEIGVCLPITGSASSGGAFSVLAYRKVLDTPISVAPDTNFVLSLTTIVSANPNNPVKYDAGISVE